MSLDDTLFGDDERPSIPSETPAPVDGIADWQVRQLRKALDATGLTDMEARKQLTEQLIGRPVASLRELRSSDVTVLLERLHARGSAPGKKPTSGSSWDNRDEDTWIDKL